VARHLRPLFALALALAVTPTAASAAIDMKPCFEGDDVECGRLNVPIDRSGGVPGTIKLSVTRIPAAKPSGRAIFAFAGGPGQGATGFTRDFGFILTRALRSRDLIVFDQRGTGESRPIDCTDVDRVPVVKNAAAQIRACAAKLGATAPFYTTRDTVDDIESVRAAFGYEKISLYGVSYGTKVELGYAAAHPERIERMLLDSVVALDGPDPLLRENFAAAPRVMRELCAGGGCAGVTADAGADLASVVSAMLAGPLTGDTFTRSGKRRTTTLDRSTLYTMLLIGDFEPGLRAAMPAALRAAATGDPAPLLRLADLIRPPADPQPPDLEQFSTGLWLATVCAEESFPWDPGTPESERRSQAESRAAALGPSVFAPFDAGTALDWDVVQMCLNWPSPTRVPVGGDLSKVTAPVLLVNGRADLRTPVETAERVAKQLPAGAVLPVARAGHSVVGGQSQCADDAAVAFLRGLGTPPARCSAPRGLPVRPLAPTSLLDVPKTGGIGGLRGRVVKAAELTVLDALAELDLFFDDRGGLRGGSFRIADKGLELRRLSYVPGVVLSGTLDPTTWQGVLRVGGGSGVRGSIRIGRRKGAGNVVTGTLGGARIATKFALPKPPEGLGAGDGESNEPRVPVWAPRLR
jgi:pimeloyl-ACP methyl ester carboxylesterase